MNTETSTGNLLPGYYLGDDGAWLTLPWPDDLSQLPPSLGPQVIRWAELKLIHHLTGEPWRYTREQRMFLHMWYAVKKDGSWLYSSGCKRGAKGTGKDPMCGTMMAIETWGPVDIYDWNDGIPIGQPRRMSLVQIAANSSAQAQDTLRVMNAMLGNDLIFERGIDKGILRTQSYDGCRTEVLTSAEKSSEGDPATAVFLNETHHMTESSGGDKVAAVGRRNVAKSPIYIRARLCEFTNAHREGQNSVAEKTYNTWQNQVQGKTRRKTLLYSSREADPNLDITDEDQLMQGLRQAYADAPWTDLERLRDEVQDTRTSVADAIRYYLNGLGSAEDAWVEARNFDALARPEETLDHNTQITMFLDCSKSGDATALVASRLHDGHIFTMGIWQSDKGRHGHWRAPREEVDARVREIFELYKVVWFGVDVSAARDDDDPDELYWMPIVDQWHRDFYRKVKVWATPGTTQGHSVLYDMRMSKYGGKQRNMAFTEAAMQTAKDIDEENTLRWDGNPLLRRHVHNAKARPNDFGVTLSKENAGSRNWVDGAYAMVGALLGRRIALNSGKVRIRSGEASFG